MVPRMFCRVAPPSPEILGKTCLKSDVREMCVCNISRVHLYELAGLLTVKCKYLLSCWPKMLETPLTGLSKMLPTPSPTPLTRLSMRPSTDSEVAFTTPLCAVTEGGGSGFCFIAGAQTSISFADAKDLAGGADRSICLFSGAETAQSPAFI